jgi:hypothetical protein
MCFLFLQFDVEESEPPLDENGLEVYLLVQLSGGIVQLPSGLYSMDTQEVISVSHTILEVRYVPTYLGKTLLISLSLSLFSFLLIAALHRFLFEHVSNSHANLWQRRAIESFQGIQAEERLHSSNRFGSSSLFYSSDSHMHTLSFFLGCTQISR